MKLKDPLITLSGPEKPGMPAAWQALIGTTHRKSVWEAMGYVLQWDKDFKIEPLYIRECASTLNWVVASESLFFEPPDDEVAFRQKLAI